MVPQGFVYARQTDGIEYYLYHYAKNAYGYYDFKDIYNITEDHLIELAHKEMGIKK